MNIIQEVNNMEAMVEVVQPLADADPAPAAVAIAQHAVVLQRAERALADLQQADANLRRAAAVPPEENLGEMEPAILRRELARLERQEEAQLDQMMRIVENIHEIRRAKRRVKALLGPSPSLWSRLFNRNNW